MPCPLPRRHRGLLVQHAPLEDAAQHRGAGVHGPVPERGVVDAVYDWDRHRLPGGGGGGVRVESEGMGRQVGGWGVDWTWDDH